MASSLPKIRETANGYFEDGRKALATGHKDAAFESFSRCVQHYQYLIQYDAPVLKEKWQANLLVVEKELSNIKNGGPKEPVPEGAAPGKDKEKNKLSSAIDSAIVSERPNVSWDDVAGLDKAKESLQEAVILPTRFPQLFQGSRKPWRGVLLYGPPGTGKSYLAKACATEAQGTFYSISSSDLVSKWMGESEKLVRTLFERAREASPAIIFIDEVDSLCGSRESGENEAGRRIKTEFLVQMEGVGKVEKQLLVLGATNTPWDLDSAIRRRFERRVYIPLPEEEARVTMICLNIGTTDHRLTRDHVRRLAQRTAGFSGADVATLVKASLMIPVRKCRNATHFCQVTQESTGRTMLSPCAPTAEGAMPMTMNTMPDPSLLLPPPLLFEDIDEACNSVRPSVGARDLERYEEFTREFGLEG